VEVFRLTGLKPAVNSEHFRGSGLIRLRGREEDLGVLQNAVREAGDGGGNVIGIVASAGVGKSRLCFEFGEWCREGQIEVLEARAHVFGQATPLLPVLDILRAFFRTSPEMDPAAARQKIAGKLLELDASLVDSLPLLADFLSVADPEHPTKPLDPATRHARLREAVGGIVKAAGREVSVVIVEDLHWLDEASHDFVETLAEAVKGTNIVMVVTFRPPWSARWAARTDYSEVRLAELDQRDVRQLVRDLTGDAPALERMIAHVADQSGGNPFFAEELVLSLAQSGVLVGSRGSYSLAPSGWHDPVLPPTIEAVVGARIDRLAERQKAVLQIGAVIGKEFPRAVVSEVAQIDEPVLQGLFDRLCEAELIQPRTTGTEASFAFRHPLIQEVAYAMQLRTTRTRLHGAVANSIASFEWGQRDEFASLLAHHYEAAGQELDAAMHLQRAARWIGRTNSARALADWKKVRRMMQGQPRSETNDQLRALAGGQLLTFGWREGMAVEEAKIYAEEALRYARESGNRKHEVLLLGGYGRIMAASGTADEYARLVREALALTDAEANPEGALLLNGLLCQACSLGGLINEALAANDAALAVIDDNSKPNAGVVLGLSVRQMVGFDVEHWVRCLRTKLLVAAGQHDAADLWLARLFQIDPTRIEPINQYIPHLEAVQLAWHRGDAVAAKRHASEISAYANKSAIPFVVVAALLGHGISASTIGDYAAAERFFREALETARQGKAGLEYEARLLAHSADAFVRTGDMVSAAKTATEAMETARRRTDRLAECHATIVRATAIATNGRAGWHREATELLDRAGNLITLTGAAVFNHRLRQAQLLVDIGER
jgi:adenylate cyclase